eukprot:Plantae.Rhodophyta-Purpureofilum_apyrenoidigerum.ctg32068.p1 GENE.Plantae.Rhodophyta-Purpureofilum_apyrenoidigerum.ctg32068~~Plantae.Rhodophyta-Purpureofilum_apyrenoidigerum.ctg32068.p1  ORF type:complete len:127 (-),score=2.37 Plantae.Rhodophyta-Purpureofilum_apyrenoidigerum.ctg32068:47-427(-)
MVDATYCELVTTFLGVPLRYIDISRSVHLCARVFAASTAKRWSQCLTFMETFVMLVSSSTPFTSRGGTGYLEEKQPSQNVGASSPRKSCMVSRGKNARVSAPMYSLVSSMLFLNEMSSSRLGVSTP